MHNPIVLLVKDDVENKKIRNDNERVQAHNAAWQPRWIEV